MWAAPFGGKEYKRTRWRETLLFCHLPSFLLASSLVLLVGAPSLKVGPSSLRFPQRLKTAEQHKVIHFSLLRQIETVEKSSFVN